MPTPQTKPTTVASGTFTASAAQVWAFRLDFANLPRYNPDVSNVRRVDDGAEEAPLGVGSRFRFSLADPRDPDTSHPVELWIEEAEEPTLVSAGMRGVGEAYEEFVVEPLAPEGCRATLNLWLFLPDLPERAREQAVTGAYAQIRKEILLMQKELDGQPGDAQ